MDTPTKTPTPKPSTAAGPNCAEAAGSVARKTAANLDSLLMIQINERLGEGAWTLVDLRGRLTRVTDRDQTSETWCLDGKPIMQTWPLQVAQVRDGHNIKLTVTQPYRTFSQNNRDLPCVRASTPVGAPPINP